MEINLKKLSEQAIETTTGSKKMRLSENATSMVFQLFTKNVYSNPIGTVVREITSNCFDSHTEAGVNSPVVIRKSVEKETGTISISFIDYGVGMSPDRIENIYGVYFESTKRTTNEQIGGFGIGGKTPLAYKRSTGQGEGEYDNSFYVITNFNGIRYYYCIYEGSESPIISLLHQEETTDRNGTEVRIPVMQKDILSFKKEMVRQLYYFENIVFEGFEEDATGDTYDKILTNQYQIVRAKTFLYRGNHYGEYVHVCLGRVAYPLDYNVLGLSGSEYKLPIALRLNVGEIGVTVSRETLDYSESTIKLLKKKLEEAKAEIREMLVKQYSHINTLEEYFMAKTKFGHLAFPNNTSFFVGNILKFSDISMADFKYSFMKMPTDTQLFNLFFESRMFGKKTTGRRRRYSSNNDKSFTGGYEQLLNTENVYFIEGEYERKIVKQAYMKSLHDRYYIIAKKNVLDRGIMADIADLFNVHDRILEDNGLPTDFGKTLMELQNEYMSIVQKYRKDYNEIEVPEDFIQERKRKVLTKDILSTTIPVKFIDSYTRYRVKLDELFKLQCPVIYGTKEDGEKLKTATSIFKCLFPKTEVIRNYYEFNNTFMTNDKNKNLITFIMVANNNVKYMEYCKNPIHVNDIYWKMFHRKAEVVREYFQTQLFINKYESIDKLYISKGFKNVSPAWERKIGKVTKYVKKVENVTNNRYINHQYELARYFNLDTIQPTKEQLSYVKTIEEVLEMQELNADTLKFIEVPYYLNDSTPAMFWEILKKVLVY